MAANEPVEKLINLIAAIQDDLDFYNQLFGTEERVALLNRRTPEIFGRLQRALIDSIILEIAKLFDPAKMGRDKKETLSLLGVVESLALDPIEMDRLMAEIRTIKLKLPAIMDQRHGRIAHTNKSIALGLAVLDAVSRDSILDALNDVKVLARSILKAGPGHELANQILRLPPQDWTSQQLFAVLSAGNRVMDEEQKNRRAAWLGRHGLNDNEMPVDYDPGERD